MKTLFLTVSDTDWNQLAELAGHHRCCPEPYLRDIGSTEHLQAVQMENCHCHSDFVADIDNIDIVFSDAHKVMRYCVELAINISIRVENDIIPL